jgi:long-subunit acyl-CoA synthetase (AMP-forming)
MRRRDTLVHQIAAWAEETPDRPALHKKAASGWRTWTWRDYWRDVRRVAKGLIALGLEPHQSVALVGKNRPEWVVCQFGIMAAGGVPAPIYVTNTVEQAAYIVAQSGAVIAVADGPDQLSKLKEGEQRGLMRVAHFVTMDEVPGADPKVVSLEALMKLGDGSDDAELDRRLGALDPDATAFLIYTSGTTALPKGVELTERGLVAIGAAVLEDIPNLKGPEIGLSYLPLCHAAEQIFTNFLPLATGSEVYFCPELADLKTYLAEVRPTVFLGVPRVWEKFEAALRARLAEAKGAKGKLVAWAMKTELDCFRRTVREDREIDTWSRRLAHKLVLDKVKRSLGFDRIKLAGTGAAPIAMSTLELFASLGVVLHEGFGMTETTGLATMQKYTRPVFGTVGRAIAGVEVRIADDGEILLKGVNMTKGYFKKPDDTKALFTDDGWLKTGDLGTVENGYLRITGRKKDLIITAGGKNIAPAEVEQFLASLPGVGQALVVGDRRPYLVLLLALDAEACHALADAADAKRSPIQELASDPKVHAFVERWIEDNCNKKVARYQTIKRFEILPAPFTIATGELTPTMKVKRNVVLEKYGALVERMYAGSERAAVNE